MRKAAAATEVLPGLALTAAIAASTFVLRQAPGLAAFSPLILSIVIGTVLRNVAGVPASAKPGVHFALRRVLRLGIILLGLQLTFEQVVTVGARGLLVILATLVTSFAFTTLAGRVFGVDRKLTELIAAGTAICGASAVIATNTVTNAADEDVAYAVACVTIFGSAAMLLYPLMPGLLHLVPHAFGLWTGASIHEIAQVVAAAYQDGNAAGDFATIAKLSRVIMLAPLVMVLGVLTHRRAEDTGHGRRLPVPWFVFGFIALILLNSAVPLGERLKADISLLTSFLLSMALAAMGLETQIAKLCARGWRPFVLALAAALFIAGFSLILVKIVI
jgi:uncharacterized integral membrane protein (TIGR00698 family)